MRLVEPMSAQAPRKHAPHRASLTHGAPPQHLHTGSRFSHWQEWVQLIHSWPTESPTLLAERPLLEQKARLKGSGYIGCSTSYQRLMFREDIRGCQLTAPLKQPLATQLTFAKTLRVSGRHTMMCRGQWESLQPQELSTLSTSFLIS